MPSGTVPVEYPYARIRTIVDAHRGDVTRFVVQLEYNVQPGFLESDDWRQVARFDHDPAAEMGHDVREEGLHMDVYRDGEKVDVLRGFPMKSPNEAPSFCRDVLEERAPKLLARFEDWHGIDGNWND